MRIWNRNGPFRLSHTRKSKKETKRQNGMEKYETAYLVGQLQGQKTGIQKLEVNAFTRSEEHISEENGVESTSLKT